MNKKQAEHREWIINALGNHGVTRQESETLIRLEMTLHRWSERECGDGSNWAIERDEETGKPFNCYHGEGKSRRYPIADREAGALKRIAKICAAHGLSYYHQGDARGASLYIIRPGDIAEGHNVESCYNRGLCICGR
jgi:hypothetical protein